MENYGSMAQPSGASGRGSTFTTNQIGSCSLWLGMFFEVAGMLAGYFEEAQAGLEEDPSIAQGEDTEVVRR